MIIKELKGSFSVHGKKIILLINKEEHDISDLFPEHKYSDDELNHPEINWKIRIKISQAIRKYVHSLDATFPIEKIIC